MTTQCATNQDGVELVLRNELGELDRLVPFVEDYERRAALPSSAVFAIQLCLDEAISNIVRHGAGSGAGVGAGRASRIAVSLRAAGDRAELLVVDDGPPFDPTRAPPPRRATSLEDAQVGGLGVHLMRQFSATMRYERAGIENRLALSFVWTPE
jgi:serine/threonine-protein kinase RsbW